MPAPYPTHLQYRIKLFTTNLCNLLVEKWNVCLTVLKAVFDTFMELQDNINLQMILLCLQLVGAQNWWHRYLKKSYKAKLVKDTTALVCVYIIREIIQVKYTVVQMFGVNFWF